MVSHTLVSIRILDVNDNPPELATPYEASICEDAKPGQVCFYVIVLFFSPSISVTRCLCCITARLHQQQDEGNVPYHQTLKYESLAELRPHSTVHITCIIVQNLKPIIDVQLKCTQWVVITTWLTLPFTTSTSTKKSWNQFTKHTGHFPAQRVSFKKVFFF